MAWTSFGSSPGSQDGSTSPAVWARRTAATLSAWLLGSDRLQDRTALRDTGRPCRQQDAGCDRRGRDDAQLHGGQLKVREVGGGGGSGDRPAAERAEQRAQDGAVSS